LDAIVVARPQPTPQSPQHLCLDLGYDNPTGTAAMANTVERAHVLIAKFSADDAQRAPTAVAALEHGFDDATAVLALPEPCRQRQRATNAVERLNEEVHRCKRVIRIFPNRESVMRLLGALLMEQDELWSTGKCYVDMTAYLQWRAAQSTPGVHEGGFHLTA
jgi:putative transposase